MMYLRYTKKIAEYLIRNCEIIMHYKERESLLWYYDKKKNDTLIFYIKYELALEMSNSDALRLDSGNWETGDQTFRLDFEKIKIENIKNQLIQILKKHDASRQQLKSLKDLK